ncbi:MAG: methyltransferase domain-containing protein [Patescibacteria group bacterium]
MNGFKGNKKEFTRIYKTNHWGSNESFSGPGSELRQTIVIREELPILFNEFNIRSMLDIPCGDFNWMKKVNLSLLNQYIGADIVSEVINLNVKKYENDKYKFVELDLIKNNLPKVDLVFCKDCLVHLSFQDIFKAINNIKKSESTYLLLTNFNKEVENIDTRNVKWRPLNFQIPPFNFCDPIKSIDINFTNNGKQHPGNGMALWKISDLILN